MNDYLWALQQMKLFHESLRVNKKAVKLITLLVYKTSLTSEQRRAWKEFDRASKRLDWLIREEEKNDLDMV